MSDPPHVQQTPLDVAELPGGLNAALEAILMVVDHPVSEYDLADGLEVAVAQIRTALVHLQADYDARGCELRKVGGGWRIYSRAEFAPVVQRFVVEGQASRLSQAAMETLAVVAYRQPISRARISAIRGVNVDGVVRTLVARGLLTETDRDPTSGALLYVTTPYFLEKLGLDSLEELPPISPHLPGTEDLDEFQDE
ncbi:MAG: SMC-Scp complex subunit ScpB [Kocuria sp.]|nr:SMC-Scp complex subunit ScpB [Kocuria sp.]